MRLWYTCCVYPGTSSISCPIYLKVLRVYTPSCVLLFFSLNHKHKVRCTLSCHAHTHTPKMVRRLVSFSRLRSLWSWMFFFDPVLLPVHKASFPFSTVIDCKTFDYYSTDHISITESVTVAFGCISSGDRTRVSTATLIIWSAARGYSVHK